jgi:hypothetical protein
MYQVVYPKSSGKTFKIKIVLYLTQNGTLSTRCAKILPMMKNKAHVQFMTKFTSHQISPYPCSVKY